jgi:hypothetical protein
MEQRRRKEMELMQVSPEIMEHARGVLAMDLSELPATAGTGYQCKLYKARLEQASQSKKGVLVSRSDQNASRSAQSFAIR